MSICRRIEHQLCDERVHCSEHDSCGCKLEPAAQGDSSASDPTACQVVAELVKIFRVNKQAALSVTASTAVKLVSCRCESCC